MKPLSSFGKSSSDSCPQDIKNAMKGDLSIDFYCANSGNSFRLVKYFGFKGNNFVGRNIRPDGLSYGGITICPPGNYKQLKMSKFDKVPLFYPGTRVLALKPKGNDIMETDFSYAKVVSKPKKCKREIRSGPPSRCEKRQSYKLLFEGESTPRQVFEEFIVPTHDLWGQEQDTYGTKPSDDSSDSSSSDSSSSDSSSSDSNSSDSSSSDSSSSDSSSSDSSSSDSSSSDSSSSSESEKRHVKKRRSHKKHHHKRSRKAPIIILMPIYYPYPQNMLY